MFISALRVSQLLLILAVISTRFESAHTAHEEPTPATHGDDVVDDNNNNNNEDDNNSGELLEQNPEELTYGVIVDCGSSGSRAHIYHWNSKLEYPELLQKIEPMRDDQGQPISKKEPVPLSSVEDKAGSVGAYFKNLMKFISDKIPESRHPFTGIYIMATAGMRLLSEDDQKAIMGKAKEFIVENYNFGRVETSVISGANEGMYQWISVNAKAKRFLSKSTVFKTKTYAVIEMGGASVQVTYQLRPHLGELVIRSLPQKLRQTYIKQIVEPQMSRSQLLEHNYTLHSTTFLGFGSNSARSAYVDLLVKSNEWKDRLVSWTSSWLPSWLHLGSHDQTDGVITVDDPCLPRGHEETFRKPKRMLAKSNQTIGFILDEDEGDMFMVRLRGASNYDKCKRLVQKMLRVAKQERLNCKPNEACTMDLLGEDFVPFNLPIRIDFLGIGDLYHTTYIMLRAAGFYNHDNIVAKTRSICNMSKRKLLQLYPQVYDNEKSRDRIWVQCFKAVWVDTFLVRGINMPKNYNLLKTVGKIGRDDLEWTLGAVLDKSLAIERATEQLEEQMMKPTNP